MAGNVRTHKQRAFRYATSSYSLRGGVPVSPKTIPKQKLLHNTFFSYFCIIIKHLFLMKKRILLFAFLILASASTFATPVDSTTARKAAIQFLHSFGMKNDDRSLTDISSKVQLSNLYIFDIDEGRGFIVIAGDDNTEPVLAYSFSNSFPTTGLPAHIYSWYKGYELEVEMNRSAAKSQSVKEQWEDLLEGRVDNRSKYIISPMLNTTWNQSPYYNALCPYDSAAGDRPPCGCTATATAQIMKAFNHPATGYGTGSYTHENYGFLSADYGATTYLWDSMPAELNASSSEAQVNAVAELIYHIGVAVHMGYTLQGSGGKTASYGYGGDAASENAFKYNFKYSPYVWTAFRIDYSDNDWRDLMINELKAGRPILYAGYDEVQSGHAFVLDGYNSAAKRFHINWGWGGSCDGNYQLFNLNPVSSTGMPTAYHFDLFATATIGIEPFSQFGEALTTVTTAVEGDGTVTGAGTYNFGDTITMYATANNHHTRFVQWSDGCRYNPRSTVATGGNVSFTAQFAPVGGDTVRYHTTDNAMNRAANIPYGLGCDSVWGIRIPAEAICSGAQLNAVRFMGRYAGTHTLTLYTGTDSPENAIYSATFFDTLAYPFTWYQHDLPSPLTIADDQSLWIVLKCTDVDTPGVFSIYGGNTYSMLSGENLTEMGDQWKFSWMIEGLFSGNVGINENSMFNVHFSIFPNPAADRITLRGLPENATIDIVDINGRKAYSTRTAGNELTIADAHLTPGIYLVRVTSDKGIGTQRLVVK